MPPDWLLWLLPVPLATLAALAWVWWANRPRGPEDPHVSVREHERFRAALAAPVPEHGPRGRSRRRRSSPGPAQRS